MLNRPLFTRWPAQYPDRLQLFFLPTPNGVNGTTILKEVTMDKNTIKETMLSLEGAALQSAREKYFEYVADARLDRSEPIESDEQARAEIASDLSEALDDTLHDHTDKLDKLREEIGRAHV